MTRDEWISMVSLSSIPLRQLGDNNQPVESASGCLVDYSGKRLILTVSHATGNYKRWAMELKHEQGIGTKLYQIGQMRFIDMLNINTGIRVPIDFSYAIIPNDIISYYQELEPNGHVVKETPRITLLLDFNSTPSADEEYGFAGHTMNSRDNYYLFSVFRVVLSLKYIGSEGDYHLFKLPIENPGDVYFEGCSGAPIVGTDGNVPALVCGRHPDNKDIIRGISLNKYKIAVDIEVGNVK